MNHFIKHSGVIVGLENNRALVQIEQKSACATCHAKSACSASDKETKVLEILLLDDSFRIGDSVEVFAHRQLGMKAVLYAYVYPIILLIVSLVFVQYYVNEIKAAFVSLFVLAIYYTVFGLLNKKIEKTFVFQMKKAS